MLACCKTGPQPATTKTQVKVIKESTKPDWFRLLSGDEVKVYLGPVDQDSVQFLIEAIERAEQHGKPVRIEVNSPGGDVVRGMDLVRKIERAKVPVRCYADGNVISMGLIIYATCPVRTATPRSVFMWHQPSVSAIVERYGWQDFVDDAMRLRTVWEALSLHLESRSKLPAEEWLKRTARGEFWMNTAEAKAAGIVDEIVQPAKD